MRGDGVSCLVACRVGPPSPLGSSSSDISNDLAEEITGLAAEKRGGGGRAVFLRRGGPVNKAWQAGK